MKYKNSLDLSYEDYYRDIRNLFTDSNRLCSWLTAPEYQECNTIQEIVSLWQSKITNPEIRSTVDPTDNPLDIMDSFLGFYQHFLLDKNNLKGKKL